VLYQAGNPVLRKGILWDFITRFVIILVFANPQIAYLPVIASTFIRLCLAKILYKFVWFNCKDVKKILSSVASCFYSYKEKGVVVFKSHVYDIDKTTNSTLYLMCNILRLFRLHVRLECAYNQWFIVGTSKIVGAHHKENSS